jgi:hypothetical protein
MDAIDVDGPSMEELILQNAESMKQFEYLEKSLVTFQTAVSTQARLGAWGLGLGIWDVGCRNVTSIDIYET